MYDAISGIGGLKGRRSFKDKPVARVSASRAARRGLIAEAEAKVPAGVASKRKARRIPTTLRIQVEGTWRRVAADISAGGALLLLPERLELREVVVAIELKDGSGKWEATAEILRRERRGDRIAHHTRFTKPSEVAGLEAVIERCLSEGAERLPTV